MKQPDDWYSQQLRQSDQERAKARGDWGRVYWRENWLFSGRKEVLWTLGISFVVISGLTRVFIDWLVP